MTARGLHISLPLTPKPDGTCIAALQCPGLSARSRLAVYLEKLPTGPSQYAIVRCGEMASVAKTAHPEEIYVRQRFPSILPSYSRPHWFQIRRLECTTAYSELATYTIVQQRSVDRGGVGILSTSIPGPPPQDWSDVPLVYGIEKSPRALAVALHMRRRGDGEGFVLMLGAYSDFSVGFCVAEFDIAEPLPSFRKLQESFVPQPARANMVLDLHTVRVNVEERVEETMRSHDKIYLIDIEIQARPIPPTIMQIVDDAMDHVTGKIRRADGAAAGIATKKGKRGVRVAVPDKFKRLWS